MIDVHRTTSDDPRFLAMVAELDAEMWQRYGETHAQFAPHNKVDALATCVIALDGERPVGSGALRPYSADAIEVKRMYVAPAARGRGVAKQILGELLAWAAELGFPAAILETGAADRAIMAANDESVISTWRPVRATPLERVDGGWDGPAREGTVFLSTDDCRASYEELKGRGVEFTELPEERPYGIDAGFRDPSGNSFRLTQVRDLAELASS